MTDKVLGVLGGMGPLASAQFMLRLERMWDDHRDALLTQRDLAAAVEPLAAGASVQPSGTRDLSNATPLMSSRPEIAAPRASRCATSTTARSALPYSSTSALASARIERRTLSDQ